MVRDAAAGLGGIRPAHGGGAVRGVCEDLVQHRAPEADEKAVHELQS